MKKSFKQEKGVIVFMPVIGTGGVEKNLFLITNYLSNKIKKVILCTTSKKISKNFDKKVKIITNKFILNKKINIRLNYIICLVTLFKFLKKNRNFVVLSFQANIYCVLICKLLNVDVIVRSNTSPAGWDHNFIKRFFYKKIIKNTNLLIVNSFKFEKQIKRMYNVKAKCILNPLNTSQILKKINKKNTRKNYFKTNTNSLKLINIGRLTDQKDQITILKAVNLLKNKINYKLIIIGNGYEKENLQKYINQYKLEKNVKILNFTKHHYSILNEADVFILSSLYEGLPNVLLEAAFLKKFIISTNCPTGPSEILQNGKGGFLFKIRDHEELAKKIILYQKQKNKLKKKISFTYGSLRKYDYDKNLNEYYSAIKKIL